MMENRTSAHNKLHGWHLIALAAALAVTALTLIIQPTLRAEAQQAAVSGLTLTSATPGELTATWDAPDQTPTDYRVNWGESGEDFPSYKGNVGNAYPATNSHTVTGLEEGTEYKARVRARYRGDQLEEGQTAWSTPWSEVARITIAAQAPTPTPTPEPENSEDEEPPAAPANLSGTVTHDSVTLTWDNSQDDSITGYQVLRRDRAESDSQFTALAEDTGSTETSYTDADVREEGRYAYRVKARNSHGLSPASSDFTADLPAPPVPEAPTGLSGAVTYRSVSLTWDDSQDESITGYQLLRLQRGVDQLGNFHIIVDDTANTETAHTDTDVDAGERYVYRVKARNQHGLSSWSNFFKADLPDPPPDPDKDQGGANDLGDITGQEDTAYATHSLDGKYDSVDYFKLTLNKPKQLHAGAQQLDADIKLAVEDEHGNELASQTSQDNGDLDLDLQLLEGTYYIRVEAAETGQNDYQLAYSTETLTQDQIDTLRTGSTGSTATRDQAVFAGPLNSNQEGHQTLENAISQHGDPPDWHTFTTETGGVYTVTLTPAADDTDAALQGIYDSLGEPKAYPDPGTPLLTSFVEKQGGTRYALVRSDGSHQLGVSESSGTDGNRTGARDLGDLSSRGAKRKAQTLGGIDTADVFKFSLATPRFAPIQAKAGNDTPKLELLDEGGNLLHSNRSDHFPKDSILPDLRDGTYYVRVSTTLDRVITYNLSIESHPAAPDNVPDEVDIVHLPAPDAVLPTVTTPMDAQPVEDTDSSTATAPTIQDGLYPKGGKTLKGFVNGWNDQADVYRINLRHYTEFSVALTGLETKTDLYLLDLVGGVLESSKLAGPRAAIIDADLEPGVYYLRVQARETGDNSYVLRHLDEITNGKFEYAASTESVSIRESNFTGGDYPDEWDSSTGTAPRDGTVMLGSLGTAGDIDVVSLGNLESGKYYQIYLDKWPYARLALSTGNPDWASRTEATAILDSSGNVHTRLHPLHDEVRWYAKQMSTFYVDNTETYYVRLADPQGFDTGNYRIKLNRKGSARGPNNDDAVGNMSSPRVMTFEAEQDGRYTPEAGKTLVANYLNDRDWFRVELKEPRGVSDAADANETTGGHYRFFTHSPPRSPGEQYGQIDYSENGGFNLRLHDSAGNLVNTENCDGEIPSVRGIECTEYQVPDGGAGTYFLEAHYRAGKDRFGSNLHTTQRNTMETKLCRAVKHQRIPRVTYDRGTSKQRTVPAQYGFLNTPCWVQY